MKNECKCNEMRNYLIDNVLMKAHYSATSKGDRKAVTIIEGTINELYKIHTPKGVINFFNNIVKCNTSKLKWVSKYLKNRKILRLEDVKRNFDKSFNSKWLNK